jgi:hypothetical protein
VRRFTVTALVLAVSSMLAVMAPSASAVTGGQPDGDRHFNVGLILFYTEEGRFRCSATLISPTVLLTAAHCTDGVLGSTLVTFDSVIAEQPPSRSRSRRTRVRATPTRRSRRPATCPGPPESGPQKPQPMTYPLIRRFTTSPGQKLTPQILQLNGNPNDIRGGGGTCFGDSGGPVFLDGELVAVTSYGYTSNCRYLGGYQRVEIPVVEEWVATFGL